MYKEWLNKDWTEVSSNESVLPKMINFEQIIESIFQNLIFHAIWKNQFIWTYFLFNRCLGHFIYVKMSKIWKNAKISKKYFFMNSRDIFMWVMVDENTSPGSVLDTISRAESSWAKKNHYFWPPANLFFQ